VASPRPSLTLLPGGDQPDGARPPIRARQAQIELRLRCADSAVYRRRRVAVAALALLIALVLAVGLTAGTALARTGGGPLTATGAQSSQTGTSAILSGAAQATRSGVWVVRPGDTLWAIASALEPRGDIRPLVDRLEAEVGTTGLQPGQSVPLPAGV
jgi:hypothetical protein